MHSHFLYNNYNYSVQNYYYLYVVLLSIMKNTLLTKCHHLPFIFFVYILMISTRGSQYTLAHFALYLGQYLSSGTQSQQQLKHKEKDFVNLLINLKHSTHALLNWHPSNRKKETAEKIIQLKSLCDEQFLNTPTHLRVLSQHLNQHRLCDWLFSRLGFW